MKACLMRVNYNPKYVVPHQNQNTLEARLNVTKNIYTTSLPDKRFKDSPEYEAPRRKLKWSSPPKPTSTEGVPKFHSSPEKQTKRIKDRQKDLPTVRERHQSGDQSSPESTPRPPNNKHKGNVLKDKVKDGASDDSAPTKRAGNPEKNSKSQEQEDETPNDNSKAPEKFFKPREQVEREESTDKRVVKHREGVAKAYTTLRLQPLKPIRSEKASLTFNNTLPVHRTPKGGPYAERPTLKHRNSASNFPVFTSRRPLYAPPKTSDAVIRVNGMTSNEAISPTQRSKTVPIKPNVFKASASTQMEMKARCQAERAMRERKVFTIKGPYNSLRVALRKRGWVEKFHNSPPLSPVKESGKEETGNRKVYPWEEEKGFYNLMSHVARSTTPAFMFAVKPGDVSATKDTQLVNHFGKSKSFTTKIGLSANLREVPWFEKTDPDTFYPRCYHITEQEEKTAFTDDYRLVSCIGFVRHFMEKYDTQGAGNLQSVEDSEKIEKDEKAQSKSGSGPQVSVQALEIAMQQCERFLSSKAHEDIDGNKETMSGSEWAYFLKQFYSFVQDDGEVSPVSETMVSDCKDLLKKVKKRWPQYELDGTNNVWILKPGAMSRGRGIRCLNNFEEMMKILDGDINMVVQKYIERPFLVYQIKFDIRQWFLVTEINPLTLWFYNECYLRFCSQDYTLNNFDVAIHLSNNSVQKYFNVQRSTDKLPDDNTWTSEEFEEFLQEKGYGSVWKDKVIPGMKKAIVCSLLCSQEHVESRKSAFALYGADFMVTEDMQPWLLEINSSPSMSRSTHATAKLVDTVLEDVVKVVVDRRYDRNASTGGFEMIYKQPPIRELPPTDFSLAIAGKKVSRT